MSYRTTFPNRHTLLPVIHVQDAAQAIRNTTIAREAGADGVFLINHDIEVLSLVVAYNAVRKEHPDWWVGVNFLGIPPTAAFLVMEDTMDGLWVDNARIDELHEEQPRQKKIQKAREICAQDKLYFGGVAFKYQREVADISTAAEFAALYMDVVTTSGHGTGKAAHPEKIRTMKRALEDHPLAIASGITPENVHEYMDADCFIVATGISNNFYNLDAAKVRDLATILKDAEGGDP